MENLRQLRGHSGPVADQIVKLGEEEITLGRDLANDVVIADSEVSRVHARVSWRDGQHIVQDLKSTNGTWINGRAAMGATPLHLGDLLTLGKTSVFVYETAQKSELDTTREDEPELATSTIAMPVTPEVARLARELLPAHAQHPLQRSALDVGPAGVPVSGEAPVPPVNDPITPGRSFHGKYIAFLRAGDLEGLTSLYHPDAIVLSIDRRATGTDEIRNFLRAQLGSIGHAHARATGKCVEGPDAVLCETVIEMDGQVARVQDGFVLKDGKVSYHFTAVVGLRFAQLPGAPG